MLIRLVFQQVPPPFGREDVREKLKKLPGGPTQPLTVHLRQEIDRLNAVIALTGATLRDIRLAIAGLRPCSLPRDVISSNEMPAIWWHNCIKWTRAVKISPLFSPSLSLPPGSAISYKEGFRDSPSFILTVLHRHHSTEQSVGRLIKCALQCLHSKGVAGQELGGWFAWQLVCRAGATSWTINPLAQ